MIRPPSAPAAGRDGVRHRLAGLCAEVDELARELSEPPSPRRPWPPSGRTLLSGLAAALVLTGAGIAAGPLVGLVQRSRADGTALAQWRQRGSQAVVGSLPAASPSPVAAGAAACGGASAADSYALVTFPSLTRYGYAAVAGDGTWDLLLQRSMVHFHGSAAPGQAGNDIIAFHREPEFEHIDELGPGDLVLVEDRACRTWTYRIRHRWVLSPQRVDQLAPTADAELTLVTCHPWFRDTQRIVWQGSLVEPVAAAPPPVGPGGAVEGSGAAPPPPPGPQRRGPSRIAVEPPRATVAG
jgi:LPXTG-site transpeptidase (sortase) family protein